MKQYISRIYTLFFLLGSLIAFSQDFEGTISMSKVEGDTQKVTKFYLKGDLVLVEMQTSNGPAIVINNRTNKTSTSLFSKNGKKYAFIAREAEQKEYPLDERQKLFLDMAKKQMSMEKTEEYRQIGEYRCQKIIGQDHKEHIEAWVTDAVDLSLFDLFPQKQSPESESVDLQKKIWEEGFVIEYWAKSKSDENVTKVTFDLKNVSVDDKVFTYNKEEYYEFDKTTLNNLYLESAKSPEKMAQLRELLDAFQSN